MNVPLRYVLVVFLKIVIDSCILRLLMMVRLCEDLNEMFLGNS